MGLFGWASNLHLVSLLGIDTGYVLDIADGPVYTHTPGTFSRPQNTPDVSHSTHPRSSSNHAHPSTLYPALYKLSLVSATWTLLGWWTFAFVTGYEADLMDKYRVIPVISMVVAVAAVFGPNHWLAGRERKLFRA